MFRTIAVRSEILRSGLKKAIRSNAPRCMSTECARRRHPNRLTNPTNRKTAILSWSPQQFRYYSSLPSHIKVNLPALSPTMESGSIVSWEKKEGDKLSEGDLLCEIETDKATMGFETPEEGYLAKILIPKGAKGVPVGKLLCIIVENQADVAAFADFKDDGASSSAPAAAAPAAAAPAPAPSAAPAMPSAAPTGQAAVAAPAAPSGSRVFASPMARRLAEVQSKRLEGPGSGIYGSVKSSDLGKAAAAGGAAGASAPTSAGAPRAAPRAPGANYLDIPLTSMRSTIAKRLSQSKQSVPHYQLSVTVNIDKTLAFREQLNARLEKEKAGVKVSVNDFIIKAVASACKRVPAVNAAWMDTFIRQYDTVDVSVAVATPSGLITPIIFGADSRGLVDVATAVKELAAKAKDGKLKPEEFQGGTITISNLGMFGITDFNAIINPPQSCILACGGVQEMVVPDKNTPEGWRVAKFVTFTASADHRVIDGAVGATWMKAFKLNMEDPANIIL